MQQIELIEVGRLQEHPDNPRLIKTARFKDLCESIRRNQDYFETRPILCSPLPRSTAFGGIELDISPQRYQIFAGTMRWRAAQEIGMEKVPCVIMDISDERQREIMVRDNQSSGEWNFEKLVAFGEPILMDAGFTKMELHDKFAVFRETEDDGFDAEAEKEKIAETLVKRGDVFKLGRHYLMCGDSTDPNDVKKLMDGAKADMIFTDPPYNIAYEDSKGTTIENDSMPDEQFYTFLSKAFMNAYHASALHATIYVCYADKTYRQFIEAFENMGWHWHQNITWLKDRFNLSGTHFHHVNERIMYGWKKGETPHTNESLKTNTDVWDLDQYDFMERLDVWKVNGAKRNERIHSNQKPIKLIEIPMRKSMPHEGIVLDLFAGGGSTLIAAEQMGATAYLMELDPKYVEVIRGRWKLYAELHPEIEKGQETQNE